MDVTNIENKNRIILWDNLKVALIILVVLGHLLLPIRERYEATSIHALYYWIYLFHMPAFVFVSGALAAKSRSSKTNWNRIIGFMMLFLFFKVLIWIVESAVVGKVRGFSFFSDSSAPWYLASMFWWYLFLPLMKKIQAPIAITISVIISLLVGLESNANSFLALAKTINFAPFFLAGYYLCSYIEKTVESIENSGFFRAIGGVVLAVFFVGVYRIIDLVKRYSGYLYGDKSYEQININVIEGMVLKIIWYLAAIIMVCSIIMASNRNRCFYSYIGSRTLSIYIMHRLARPVIQYYLDHIGYETFDNDILATGIYVGISVMLVFLFSIQPLNKMFNGVLSFQYVKNSETDG